MEKFKVYKTEDVVTSSVGDHRGDKSFFPKIEGEIVVYLTINPSGKPFERHYVIAKSQTGFNMRQIAAYFTHDWRVEEATGKMAEEFKTAFDANKNHLSQMIFELKQILIPYIEKQITPEREAKIVDFSRFKTGEDLAFSIRYFNAHLTGDRMFSELKNNSSYYRIEHLYKELKSMPTSDFLANYSTSYTRFCQSAQNLTFFLSPINR